MVETLLWVLQMVNACLDISRPSQERIFSPVPLRKGRLMAMESSAPDFDNAAVYVVIPDHVPEADVVEIGKRVSEVLGEDAPLILISGSGPESEAEFLPAGAILRVVGPPLVQAGIGAVSRVIKDNYNDNRAAQAHYDARATAYNNSADRWWAQQMGRA